MGFFSRLFRREDHYPPDDFGEEPDIEEDFVAFEAPDDPDFRMAGLRLGLVYKDSDGKVSRRVVRLKRLDGDHYEGYLTAFCELKKDVRSFLTSRIVTLFDPSTGEVLPSAEDFFGPYFDERDAAAQLRYEQGKFRVAWHLITALRFELQVLILIARADGRFVKAEQEFLLRYITARAEDVGLPCKDSDLSVLRDWLRLQDPSEPDARLAILALANNQEAMATVWEVSELMAEADGKYKPEERASVMEIRATIEDVINGRA